nr:hypothetical protein [uncultured Flavobacterium sp.]
MKKNIITIVFFTLLMSLVANSQTIEGYSFEKYKTENQPIIKKAKINYQSNSTAKTYKSRITEGYNAGKIDFAGHYILIIWGCGTGCISGAMVDIRDGKVYDIPLDEETAYYGCYSEEDERALYKPNSRLFITTSCNQTEIENSEKIKLEKTFFINVWNEPKKKFELIKKINKSYVKKSED